MDKDSRILIDDMALSNSGVHWRATQIDVLMMMLAGLERTKEQWHVLLDKAGLKILEIHTYDSAIETSVTVAVPK
jgi:demethylsterigmatocystin 6-O-methyltransferase